MAGIEGVQKTERPVVERQAQHRHIVGIHDAMAKAHGLPVRHQRGRLVCHFFKQRRIGLGGVKTFGGKVRDDKVGQLAQRFRLVAVSKVLEVPEAQKAGRHARHDSGRLHLLAPHFTRRAGDAQGSRGRNAQRVHGFRTQELAYRRAQHGASIAHARIGRQARTLELHIPRPLRCGCLAQADGAAVTELTCPRAKLVAAVDAGQRPHARPQRIAAEHV